MYFFSRKKCYVYLVDFLRQTPVYDILIVVIQCYSATIMDQFVFPQKFICGMLTLSTLESDCIWGQAFKGVIKLK